MEATSATQSHPSDRSEISIWLDILDLNRWEYGFALLKVFFSMLLLQLLGVLFPFHHSVFDLLLLRLNIFLPYLLQFAASVNESVCTHGRHRLPLLTRSTPIFAENGHLIPAPFNSLRIENFGLYLDLLLLRRLFGMNSSLPKIIRHLLELVLFCVLGCPLRLPMLHHINWRILLRSHVVFLNIKDVFSLISFCFLFFFI